MASKTKPEAKAAGPKPAKPAKAKPRSPAPKTKAAKPAASPKAAGAAKPTKAEGFSAKIVRKAHEIPAGNGVIRAEEGMIIVRTKGHPVEVMPPERFAEAYPTRKAS